MLVRLGNAQLMIFLLSLLTKVIRQQKNLILHIKDLDFLPSADTHFELSHFLRVQLRSLTFKISFNFARSNNYCLKVFFATQ
jgi:hypothetical protein